MISGYKSIRTIIEGLYRDLDYNTELNEISIISWCGEALLLIGAYSQFTEEIKCVDVCNHEAELPCDFYKLIDISHNKRAMHWATKTLAAQYGCDGCKISNCCTENEFYITNFTLRTSFKEGSVCLNYLAVPTDEEGYPLIPDDVYFDKALKSYCTYMLDRIEFRKAKIPEVAYRDSEKDWYFYVSSAKGSANMPNAAQMENLLNTWVRLIPKQNLYNKNFRGLTDKENRKLFN